MKILRNKKHKEEPDLDAPYYDLFGHRYTRRGYRESKKLKKRDRFGFASSIYDKDLSEDEFKKVRNRISKSSALYGAATGGVIGGIFPRDAYDKMARSEELKSRLKLGAVLSGAYAGLGASNHLRANMIREKLKSDDPKYDKFKQRAMKRADRSKVLEGKMTAAEFNRKYYNN